MKTIRTIIILLTLAIFFAGITAFAAEEKIKPTSIPCVPGLPCITEETQQKSGGVQAYITEEFAVKFFTGFLGISAVTAVIFLIVGGLQMHLALGAEEAIKKAKTTIIWAIVGLVISILAIAIVQIVSNINFSPT